MSGAYAHITLVNEVPEGLESIPGFPPRAILAVKRYLPYCELGAVSPDYPYLALGDSKAAKWADQMHYVRTGDMIHAGIERVRAMSSQTQLKCLAWLLGYAAHVTTDVTIHPVVELRVGPYEENKAGHRTCEMHQDAYIFQRLNIGEMGLADHLKHGIALCGSNEQLDTDIKELWRSMLQEVHPDMFMENSPDLDKWHRGFLMVVDWVEEGQRLIPFARHLAAEKGITYPAPDRTDPTYIENLTTPTGQAHYDEVFDLAKTNTGRVWSSVALGALEQDQGYRTLVANWNLDTGRDLIGGQYAFWS